MASQSALDADHAARSTPPGGRPVRARQRRGHRSAQRRAVNWMERNSLRGPLLRSVSRSFYLSLRFLPKALRDPLSLAYLLARATDTIADTTAAPVALRTEALRHLAGMIQGNASKEETAKLHQSFGPLQSDKAERVLIEQVPALLDWLGELSAEDRKEVRSVLV